MPRVMFNAPNYSGAVGATDIRGWATALSSALAAVGLVRTSDTGQADTTTIVSPATGTSAGYEIWKLSDAPQSTAPIYLKVGYGAVSGSPRLEITVGTGTDGAGNLTGVLYGPVVSGSSGGQASRASASYVSSDGSSLAILLWPGDLGYTFKLGFFLERSRDSSGVPTAEGLAVGYSFSSSGFTLRVLSYSTPAAYSEWQAGLPVKPPYFVGGNVTLSVSSSAAPNPTEAPAIPVAVYGSGVRPWVLQTVIMVLPGDSGAGSLPVATINGSVHQYRAVSNQVDYAGWFGANGAQFSIYPCIWWEA